MKFMVIAHNESAPCFFLLTLPLLSIVSDFLAFARNLTEDVFIEEGKKWTARSAAEIALESDEAALEYLCKLNYDLPLAKFNLMCRMSVGKGWSR